MLLDTLVGTDAIGRTILGAGPGAYVMTVASLAGLLCAIAVAIGRGSASAASFHLWNRIYRQVHGERQGENQNVLVNVRLGALGALGGKSLSALAIRCSTRASGLGNESTAKYTESAKVRTRTSLVIVRSWRARRPWR